MKSRIFPVLALATTYSRPIGPKLSSSDRQDRCPLGITPPFQAQAVREQTP